MSELITESLAAKKLLFVKGVIYLSDPETSQQFEDLYSNVREKEGRIYPDEVVKNLPVIEASHPLFPEWQIRAGSLYKLEAYLVQKAKPLMILELGCGNGWLSNRLAQISGCTIYAVDLNRKELEQGARVLSETHSLKFIYGNIFEDIFRPARFDLILLASSVQYFPDLNSLLQRLIGLLKQDGEIHLIDTPFYSEESAGDAKRRSADYYQNLGYPEMVRHYYQRRWTELAEFEYNIKYDPKSYIVKFRRRFLKEIVSPFPWIVIRFR
jgi:ubiquinone/menaquinone biosynthesis C-methylase UbiE